MNRLYAAESTPTLTGMVADHRLPVSSAEIESITRQITSKIGNAQKNDGAPSKWLDALVQDLQQHRGSSIVIAGEWQPPTVHALAHSLNEKLEKRYENHKRINHCMFIAAGSRMF